MRQLSTTLQSSRSLHTSNTSLRDYARPSTRHPRHADDHGAAPIHRGRRGLLLRNRTRHLMKRNAPQSAVKMRNDATHPDWHKNASCHGMTELFFSTTPIDMRQAIRICRTCPVRSSCFTTALDQREMFGIWAGHSQRQLHLAIRERVIASQRLVDK
jgi:hypothetical protein